MKYWDEQKRLYPKWTANRERYAELFGREVIRPRTKDIIECIAFSLAGSALGFAILAVVIWLTVS